MAFKMACAMLVCLSVIHRSPCRLRASLCAGLAAFCLMAAAASAQQGAPQGWSDRETRLANEYLSLLVGQPEYGRVVELLWALYEKHGATELLLENVSTQAEQTRHPTLRLVQGHLLRRAGDLAKAVALYEEVLAAQPENVIALRSRAEAARELGDAAGAYDWMTKLVRLLPAEDAATPAAWLELGTQALAAEKPAEARAAWEKAAALRPEDAALARQVAGLLLRAGMLAEAAVFYEKLAAQSEPARRLEALSDLARIHELAADFDKADAALSQALAVLDFRDGRHTEFFRRRVRLHERAGLLDEMRAALEEAAARQPPEERALRELTRFFEFTVDVDAHVAALRALVKAVPQVPDYRWELVRALLDHDGAQEAATLLDELLAGAGPHSPALVFLRCEADLRLGDAPAAAERLEKLLAAGADAEVEKAALTFAQTRSLDAVVEAILRRRVERDPSRQEAVFELAGFYRARKNTAAADLLLRQFTEGAVNDVERVRRMNDAAAFLAGGQDSDSAVMLARELVARPDAGREQWLRLADLLAERGELEEAATWLEKAWTASTTDEDRAEVDERLFSILIGDKKIEVTQRVGTAGEFQLPDAFTGKGFAGSGDQRPDEPTLPEAVLEKARALFTGAEPAGTAPERLFRAAWWALRTDQRDAAYPLLHRLGTDPATGLPRPLSLEAEKLLLELALADQNRLLAMRVLRRLMEKDEPGRIRHILRLSELMMEAEQTGQSAVQSRGWQLEGQPPPPAQAATRFLEDAWRRFPDSEQLLSALSQCYTLQRRHSEVATLWKNAIRRAGDSAAIPLMERYAELLMRQHKVAEYIEVQTAILEKETDVKRRRESHQRFLDRLLWTGQGNELPEEEAAKRLDLLEKALTALARKHPFDGFYHEALALVLERKGQAAQAFQSMKQAYYTAPDTPFSASQLRDAALRVQDLTAAIYFQKQIAALAPPSELAAESRRLVEMLEQTFQIAEADRVRRRLESRFSQDAAALESLAEHYRATGQDEAERRVYEQIARVRPWDARSLFRIALKSIRLADDAAAESQLQEILAKTTDQAHDPRREKSGRLALPITDQRKDGAPGPAADVADLAGSAPGLTHDETGRLRVFLALPRPEFAALPDEVKDIRLRAIEELARLRRRSEDEARLAAWKAQWAEAARSPLERLWALYYAGAGQEFRALLSEVMGSPAGLEGRFSLLWLMLRSQGMEDALRWSGQTGLDILAQESRRRLLQACAAMLAADGTFRYAKGSLADLGASRQLANSAILEITRSLQDRQRYAEALELGESLRKNSPGLAADYAYFLSRIAESAERWDLARDYLGQVVRGPVRPGAYRGTYDPYIYGLATASRLAISEQEREETLSAAWRHLQSVPDSSMTRMRRAVVAGLAGARQTAAGELEDLIAGDFMAARQMGELRGMLMPQGSNRHEEPMHLRSFWEEAREIQAVLVQQGLSGVVQEASERLDERFGSTTLSSRAGMEFGEWRLGQLMRRLRHADHPTRLRLIREHLASVDMRMEVSVDTLSELGGRLESNGMAREAVEVYRLLPGRAPANPEYALWLIRASEAARDTTTGLDFTLQLLQAEPPMKPPQPGDEVLREKHAHFLAQDFDLPELRRLSSLPQTGRILAGRIPHAVPYLRELALVSERLGHDDQALQAWEDLLLAYETALGDDSPPPDPDACLHKARLLQKKSLPVAALATLEQVDLSGKLSPFWRDILHLRTDLLAQSGGWEAYRPLMALAVEKKTLSSILYLADLLSRHQRGTEALNYLIQAERVLKDDPDRFRLRFEQLRLHAADPAWTPDLGRSQVAALFRVRSRDRETLQLFLDWMKAQAQTPNRAAWTALLRAETRAGMDRPLAALGLSAFAKDLPEAAAADFTDGWSAAREGDHPCLELGAEALLHSGRARWAWHTCQVLKDLPTLRIEGRKRPLMVRAAHAMGDNATVRELFAEILRKSFPGGNQPVEWAQAFALIGERGLARELFQAALDKNDGTQILHTGLSAAWVRFLIEDGAHAQAETFLLRQHWTLPNDTAALIVELYQSWGKLETLRTELPKYHLPRGIEKETLFLAHQALELPHLSPVPADEP